MGGVRPPISARRPLPPLARWLLAAGIGATLAVNIAADVAFGLLRAIVAAWPALAPVSSYELLMVIIRATVRASDGPGGPIGARRRRRHTSPSQPHSAHVFKNIEAWLLVRGGTAPVGAAEHVDALRASGDLMRLA